MDNNTVQQILGRYRRGTRRVRHVIALLQPPAADGATACHMPPTNIVMARLLLMLGARGLAASMMFALWMWFGFSALMWVGAVVWEGTLKSLSSTPLIGC
jgi:hypothetical protein